MYKKYISIFLLITLISAARLVRKLNFKNKCSQTIWVAGFAIPLPVTTGW
jgi:hypothetical protein